MENSRRCDICNVNIHRASYDKHLRSKNHLENMIHDEMIIPEWLFKEKQSPIKSKKKVFNSKPIKQIARQNIK